MIITNVGWKEIIFCEKFSNQDYVVPTFVNLFMGKNIFFYENIK